MDDDDNWYQVAHVEWNPREGPHGRVPRQFAENDEPSSKSVNIPSNQPAAGQEPHPIDREDPMGAAMKGEHE